MTYGFFASHRYDVESDDFEQNHLFNSVELTIEILFLLEMILMFFKEYQPKDSLYPVRKIP
jgi:hypothetical protein